MTGIGLCFRWARSLGLGLNPLQLRQAPLGIGMTPPERPLYLKKGWNERLKLQLSAKIFSWSISETEPKYLTFKKSIEPCSFIPPPRRRPMLMMDLTF